MNCDSTYYCIGHSECATDTLLRALFISRGHIYLYTLSVYEIIGRLYFILGERHFNIGDPTTTDRATQWRWVIHRYRRLVIKKNSADRKLCPALPKSSTITFRLRIQYHRDTCAASLFHLKAPGVTTSYEAIVQPLRAVRLVIVFTAIEGPSH